METRTLAQDRRWYALAGLVSGAAALAISVGIGWAFNTTNAVVAVAEFVRDHTPGPLAVQLVHLVKHADKPLLVALTVVVVLAIATGLGLVGRSHPHRSEFGALVVSALGLAALLAQPHANAAAALGTLIGLVVWIALLRALTMRTPSGAGQRRDFLKIAGGAVVVSALVLWAGRAFDAGTRAVEAARSKLQLNVAPGIEPADAVVDVPGIVPWRTAASDFYRIDTALTVPAIDPSSWKLRIHGMVDREITLTYDDLLARQLSQGWVTLCCVSNPVGFDPVEGNLISNAYFSGVPVRELLAEAGVQPGADAVLQTSYDHWTCGTPIGALTDDRLAILAVAMNGQPLPLEHGFPVRTVVPGLYGYVSACKWVVDMEVTQFSKFQAYWTERGWSERGPVKTESRIDVPLEGARIGSGSDGKVGIGGVAWAQHTGIERVEVQIDGGPWQQAELGGVPDTDTWVQWGVRVPLTTGKHQVAVRATDRSGYTQTPVVQDVLPDGATGWDSVRFSVT